MGQIEVFKVLQVQRKTGNEDYLYPKQVRKLLQESGYNSNGVWKDLIKLTDSKYLEFKMSNKPNDWSRVYRLKEQYLNLEV